MKAEPAVVNAGIISPSDPPLGLIDACSGGRKWCDVSVAEEICFHVGRGMQHFFEAGKLLLWAKYEVGRDGFPAWLVEQHLPFSQRTAYNYMQVAELLVAHPGLKGPLARMGLKKALQITALDDDAIARLVDRAEMPELEGEAFEKLVDIPYIDLKRQVKLLTEANAEAEQRATQAEEDLDRARNVIADGALLSAEDEKEISARIKKIRDAFEGAMAAVHTQLVLLGRIYPDMPRAMKARLDTVMVGMSIHVEHEQLALKDASGEYIPPADIEHVMSLAEHASWPVPEIRQLSVVPLSRDGVGPG